VRQRYAPAWSSIQPYCTLRPAPTPRPTTLDVSGTNVGGSSHNATASLPACRKGRVNARERRAGAEVHAAARLPADSGQIQVHLSYADLDRLVDGLPDSAREGLVW